MDRKPIRPGRFALPAAASVALHAAAAAAVLLLGQAGPPAGVTPSPLAVELAFAPPQPAPAAEPPPAPPQAAAAPAEPPPAIAESAPAETPTLPEPAHAAPPRRTPPRQATRPAPAAPASVATAEAPAAVTAPGPAAPAPSSGPSSAWLGALDAWIDAHLDYPEDSRRRGEQGAVLVRLTVAHDGRLLAFALLRGSGHDDLDDATRAMFRNAHLPAAPLATDPAEATLNKPVRYVLR